MLKYEKKVFQKSSGSDFSNERDLQDHMLFGLQNDVNF